MRFPVAGLVILIFTTACTGTEPGATPTAAGDGASTVTSVDPSGLIAPCLVDSLSFVDSGAVVVGDGIGDATTLATIGWTNHPGCDRVEFGFLAASGAPASAVGTSVATLMPEAGVLRLQYPDNVVATGPNDVAIDAGFVSAAFVIWTREGRLATDLHLTGEQAVAFSASTATAPAQAIIDLRPDDNGGPGPIPPVVTETLVLVTPVAGPGTYPIRVTGYAKARGGEVVIRFEGEDSAAEERQTVAAGDGSTWGEFSIVIDSGPIGAASLFVGTAVAGVERGVTLDLLMS